MVRDVAARVWNKGARGWFVRWTEPGGLRRSERVGPPGPEGEEMARAVAARLNRSEARAELWASGWAKPLPIDEIVRGWREQQKALRSERTQITDVALVERLAVHFGPRDLRDLSEPDVLGFVAAVLNQGRSGHVAANALSILRRVVHLAVKGGLLERAPAIDWAPIIRDARRRTMREADARDAWSPDEVARILELASAHERRMVAPLLAAFHTGARRGEILALRWEDVDFAARRIHWRRAAAARGGTKLPKAGRGRLEPISDTLGAVLEAQRSAQRRGALKRHAMPGWVFASPRGRFWAERNFSRTWERLRERFAAAGVRPLPLHCTRHTFITRALEAGVPVTVVAGWVGASPGVIEAHYSHVIPASWGVGFLDSAWDQIRSQGGPTEKNAMAQLTEVVGDPGAIRTRDPQLRRLAAKRDHVRDSVAESGSPGTAKNASVRHR